jgi:aryl-alcohol dehydrogenase-like predicted oxidoreductase
MEYALLGRTGVRVSRICLGTALFGLTPLEASVPALVDRALGLGINFIDVANTYGNRPSFDRPGLPPHDERKSAEELVGHALRGRRHEVVLATKVGERMHPGPNGSGLSRGHVMHQVEDSLRRLQTDYIDLYYAHHPDPATPIEETLRTMDDLVRQGKVRYFAMSNYAGWQVAETMLVAERLGLAAPVCNQVRYSMIARQVEREVAPAGEHFGISLLPFSPLGGGLLSGGANASQPIAGNQRWRGGQGPGYTPAQVGVAKEMDRLGAKWGHPAAHLALAWLLAKPRVASVVVGPGRIASLEESASAAGVALTPEQLVALDSVGADIS